MNLSSLVLGTDNGASAFLECESVDLDLRGFVESVAGRQGQLRDVGCRQGDRFLVVSGRGNDFWVDLVALWGLGCVAVPLEARTTADALGPILEKAAPRGLLGQLAPPAAEGVRPPHPLPPARPAAKSDISVCEVGPSDLACILFTSGSTGQPKGVALTHRALALNAQATAAVLPIRPGDRVFMAIPFRFVSALSHFLVSASRGATLLGTERLCFQADYVRSVIDQKATASGGSPVQARWLADAAETSALPLRWIMSSGDHLPVDVIRQLRKRLPETQIVTVYGITEVSGRFCILPPGEIDAHAGSVGKPIGCLWLAVRDEEGGPVDPGTVGEIYAEGECLFEGYYRDAEATGRSCGPHGFRTGDLGYRDADGWAYLTGRVGDVFKRGGLKVSAVPIAQAMMESGVFEDVAVLPVEHPVWGHVPHAYYVLKPGVSFDKGALLRRLRATLPANHLPEEFTPLEKIPRTGSGKVARRQLAAWMEQAARSSG